MVVINKEGKEVIQLHQGPARNSVRPAADVTMESVSKIFGGQSIGVVLTGMGHDGTQGALMMKKKGGKILVEDSSTCVVFGMPKSVIEAGAADEIYPLDAMAAQIVKHVKTLKAQLAK
jgi:two-component system chemotaxis response regulator CheB